MSIKNFLMKKMMQSQLSKLPADQRKVVEDLMEKNPDLLMKIAHEVQEEMKKGKSQEEALMAVALTHKDELKNLLQ